MAEFSFFIAPHNDMGQQSLHDIMGIVGHQLRALGHVAVFDERNAKHKPGDEAKDAFVIVGPGRYNVVIEGFSKPWVEFMARARAAGARFLIIATEEPTPKGFNWGTQKEMVVRQEIFPEAAKHCDGILHLVPGKHVTEWYSQFAPAAQAELGFAPTLLRTQGPPPEFEYGFFGSVTPRRGKILKRIAKQCAKDIEKAVKVVFDFPDQVTRDREMRRCKVILQLRKFEPMGLVSSSRCNTSLMLGRPVVAEPHGLTHPWDEVIDFAKTMDHFFEQALMARIAWQSLWRTQVERFKVKMSPEFCVGEPLRRIGILSGEGGRAAA
jgi:hypothetical protein